MAAKSTPTSIQVSGHAMVKKSSADLKPKTPTGHTDGNVHGSGKTSPAQTSAVEQVMEINRRLVAQIETLRLKVEVDARQHEKTKHNLLNENTCKVKSRELEIEQLRSDLRAKESKVKTLAVENQHKVSEIQRMQAYIDDLKDDVRQSKSYADEIQSQLDLLHESKASLESGSAYTEKDKEITELQHEVNNLKKHLFTLEKELSKAKEVIAQQGGKLRLAEIDRGNVQLKFKVELAKVTQIMRHEIEKMRDVMRQQWEEMRELRDQNEGMRNDIREIRELLVAEQVESNDSRAHGHVHNPFNLKHLSPALPALGKDNRRTLAGKKKT